MACDVHETAEALLNEAIITMAKDLNLMKMLVHDRVDIDPRELSVISKPQDFIYKPEGDYAPNTPRDESFRLYPFCYIPDVLESQRSFIACDISDMKPLKYDIVHAHYYMCFYVGVHIDLKAIKGGIRRDMKLSSYIHKLFNRKLTDYSNKGFIWKGTSQFAFNSKWQGYKLGYELLTTSDKGLFCRECE